MITIGIDPDLKASGVTVIVDKKMKICTTYSLWDLFDMLKNIVLPHQIFIEDSRLTQCSSYHAGGKGAARNVGKNMAICAVLDDFCSHHRLTYKMVKPAGYSLAYKDKKIFEADTGWTERTNEDARASAAVAIFNMKPIKK
jgi:hypothetical protein